MRNSFSKVQYLLFALLLFALTGCGANSVTTANNAQPGTLTAKIALAKQLGKQVGAITASAGVKTRLIVTGATIPTANETFDGTAGGSIKVYPGSDLIVRAEILDTTGAVVLEGYFANVSVASGATQPVSIEVAYPVVKADNVTCLACHAGTKDVTGQNLVANYKQSAHYSNDLVYTQAQLAALADKGITGATQPGCAGCHGNQHNVGNPSAAGRCAACHSGTTAALPVIHAGNDTKITTTNCTTCHQPHNTKQFLGGRCIACHSVGQDATAKGNYVDDNNGVRAITTEFSKWSHHVTGVALNDAHCAACHLEGKVVDDGNGNVDVLVDAAKHMSDNKTHLRNADTDGDFAWDPQNPNHSGMDNFCLSCHDSNGATSPMSAQIQALINAKGIAAPGKVASPSNPFGDTISNRYDKMQRPAVVDANSQFNPSNNSHHAVKGPRYTGRTRAAGVRQIAAPTKFANNSSALLKGARSTIYDAGNFNALYSPLGTDGTDATGRGDDSTLQCGDCHTVGQWKPGSSDTANGSPTPVAIGAHGANNEYLLRNTLGTDQRHTQNAFLLSATNVVTYTNPNGAFLVCFNCHSYTKYGSIYVGTGLNTPGTGAGIQPHAGEYDQAGRCNGIGNTLPFNGYTTGSATDGTQFASRFMSVGNPSAPTTGSNPTTLTYGTAAPYAGEQAPDFGNVFGIQCANCHNSGAGNAYGGIHGSANNQNTVNQTVVSTVKGGAYIDGMGNTTKIERFLPGLGNAMHVPGTLGGFTGGTTVPTTPSGFAYTYTTGGVSNDTNWEQKFWQQTATTNFDLTGKNAPVGTTSGAGCYTLGAATAATSAVRGPSVTGQGGEATELLDTWGGCEDQGAKQGGGDHGFVKRIVRPITY